MVCSTVGLIVKENLIVALKIFAEAPRQVIVHQDTRNLEIYVMLLVLYKLFLGIVTGIFRLRFEDYSVSLARVSIFKYIYILIIHLHIRTALCSFLNMSFPGIK